MTAAEGALAARLGHRFADPALLTEALTHATFAHERPGSRDYERLELLGDAVMDLLATEMLLALAPAAREGALSAQRAALVRREALAAEAVRLAVAPAVRLGAGQAATAGVTENILADVLEALAGAVYLDGGLAAARACFGPRLAAAHAAHAAAAGAPDDAKTALQEACQAAGAGRPQYVVVAAHGPGHARRFACEVRLDGRVRGRGEASRRRAAEQLCAAEALRALASTFTPSPRETR